MSSKTLFLFNIGVIYGMSIKYTEEQERLILNNYLDFGPKYCAKLLGKNENEIYAKAKRMGLKKIGYNKHPSMQAVNPEKFWNIEMPEVAYFLGYFWADGNIIHRINKTSNLYRIALEIISDDAQEILPILNKIGRWTIQTRKRSDNWKETTIITTNSKDIYNFLSENDYLNKSYNEPTKILTKIPDNLKYYWWRGYFDGDGGIAIAEKEKGRWKSLQFSSTYNYKWIELLLLFSALDITNASINNYISPKGHKSSKITLFKIKNIKKMISYLIKSEIGLTRKTNKMKEIFSRFI